MLPQQGIIYVIVGGMIYVDFSIYTTLHTIKHSAVVLTVDCNGSQHIKASSINFTVFTQVEISVIAKVFD